jgi:hypothetical protein
VPRLYRRLGSAQRRRVHDQARRGLDGARSASVTAMLRPCDRRPTTAGSDPQHSLKLGLKTSTTKRVLRVTFCDP